LVPAALERQKLWGRFLSQQVQRRFIPVLHQDHQNILAESMAASKAVSLPGLPIYPQGNISAVSAFFSCIALALLILCILITFCLVLWGCCAVIYGDRQYR
jgi:hypothetical protein